MSRWSQEYDVLLKAIVIGDSGVGKSSLLHRYTEDDFSPTYIATVGVDFKLDTFEREGKIVKLQLWDTAGQERFRTIAAAYYRGAHCVLMCYDVTDLESFASLQSWMREVEEHGREGVPIILVGTKADLPRAVAREEVEAFAERHSLLHIETSAKDSTNVHRAVRRAVDIAMGERVSELEAETEARRKRMHRVAMDIDRDTRRTTCLQRFVRTLGSWF